MSQSNTFPPVVPFSTSFIDIPGIKFSLSKKKKGAPSFLSHSKSTFRSTPFELFPGSVSLGRRAERGAEASGPEVKHHAGPWLHQPCLSVFTFLFKASWEDGPCLRFLKTKLQGRRAGRPLRGWKDPRPENISVETSVDLLGLVRSVD